MQYLTSLLLLLLPAFLSAPVGAQDDDTQIAAAVLPEPEEVIMLRMRSGLIRWGAIESHQPDGVRFFLMDTGGRVDVPWSLIDPVQELELRTRYGYVDVSSEEIFVEAERLVLKGGGEVIGVIQEPRTGDNFTIITGGNRQVVPKARVAQVQSGLRVSALEVYTREDFYRRLATGVDNQDPDALVALARDCERILDFVHAVQHYEEALALAPDHDAGATEASLGTARIKSEQQEQIEYLREIDQLRRRGFYDRALEMAQAFGSTYPESALVEDANKKRVTVLEARDRAITEEVQSQWHRYAERFAGDAARSMTFAEAQTYAGEQLTEDVLAKVTEIVQKKISPDIQPENVREFWIQRNKRVRFKLASYGNGTWLLGEEAAQKGLTDEPADAALSALDAERESLKRKIESYLKNREQALRARTRQDDAENFELFWEGWSANSRAQWVRAYYCEFGGDMELRPKPRFSNCSDCGGTGAREIIFTGGGGGNGGNPGSQIVRCPTCHGVQVVRRIYYR